MKKQCEQCKKTYPLTTKYWYKRRKWFQIVCKTCARDRANARHKQQRDEDYTEPIDRDMLESGEAYRIRTEMAELERHGLNPVDVPSDVADLILRDD